MIHCAGAEDWGMKEKWLKRERKGEDGKDILKTVSVCTGTYIHRKKTDRIRGGEFNGEWEMEKGEGEGTVQELTCPLKFSSVFAREQQPKKKRVSPDAVHMWSNISGGWQGEGMLRKGVRCSSKGGGGVGIGSEGGDRGRRGAGSVLS